MKSASPPREAAARSKPLPQPHWNTSRQLPRLGPRDRVEPGHRDRPELWDYAGQNGYTIASKDSDFRQLAFLFGPPPPTVIRLRVGNVNSAAVFKVLNDHHEAIEAFEDATDEALLLLPGLPLGQVPR